VREQAHDFTGGGVILGPVPVKRGKPLEWVQSVQGPFMVAKIRISQVGPLPLSADYPLRVLRRCRFRVVLNHSLALIEMPAGMMRVPFWDLSTMVLRVGPQDTLAVSLWSDAARVWPQRNCALTLELVEPRTRPETT
jgi:hypothetical protein